MHHNKRYFDFFQKHADNDPRDSLVFVSGRYISLLWMLISQQWHKWLQLSQIFALELTQGRLWTHKSVFFFHQPARNCWSLLLLNEGTVLFSCQTPWLVVNVSSSCWLSLWPKDVRAMKKTFKLHCVAVHLGERYVKGHFKTEYNSLAVRER